MKILLTGANGFVGQGILRYCKDLDIVKSPSLQNLTEYEIAKIIDDSECDVIVHTAAISDIGECEKQPEDSYKANVILPTVLAENANGSKLVFYSSDQVYSGNNNEGPFTENDTCPGNLYATHKLEMENRVLSIDPEAVLLRAEWMYDVYSNKGNYIKNLISANESISASSDDFRGITYLKEVAENLLSTIKLSGGAYNFGSETKISMYHITEQILNLMGKNITLCDPKRRGRLWMDCSKATKQGVIFSSAVDGVRRCVKDYCITDKTTIFDIEKEI